MKKLLAVVLLFSASNVHANWIMERFDLNEDGAIEKREITLSGCTVRAGTFEHADKNNNGVLSGKEVRDATAYLFNKRRCPEMKNIRGQKAMDNNKYGRHAGWDDKVSWITISIIIVSTLVNVYIYFN